MGTVDLEKILVTPLSRIPTTGGDVLHALKFTEIGFENFFIMLLFLCSLLSVSVVFIF